MKLLLEEPQNMKFRIYNLSKQMMDIRLLIRDQEDNDIKIINIEEGENPGPLKPGEGKDFILRLYAVKTGVISLSGLLVSDLESKKDIVFQVFSSI
jgi:hypothetical protein